MGKTAPQHEVKRALEGRGWISGLAPSFWHAVVVAALTAAVPAEVAVLTAAAAAASLAAAEVGAAEVVEYLMELAEKDNHAFAENYYHLFYCYFNGWAGGS